MRLRFLLLALAAAAFAGCGPHVVSSNPDGGSTGSTGQSTGSSDAGTLPDGGDPFPITQIASPTPYPSGPYGTQQQAIIQNFTFPGFFSNTDSVKVDTLPYHDNLDLQTIRNAARPDGTPFRYLLLDISAGWCPPCNQEADALGLHGADKTKITEWLGKGGLVLTVLVEGYVESSHAPPVAADLNTWIDAHEVQFPMGIDPNQILLQQGISATAFPTNLIIDLKTMRIVGGWAGIDPTYGPWETILNQP